MIRLESLYYINSTFDKKELKLLQYKLGKKMIIFYKIGSMFMPESNIS